MFRMQGEWTSGPPFKRGRELLQYLISYPRSAVSRESLVGAFWPKLGVEAGAHRLHIAVAGARSALREQSNESDGIRCSGRAYVWNPTIRIESDAEQLIAASRGSDLSAMKAATALYGGEYLAGEDAEWIYPLRVRCVNAYAIIVERLAEHAEACGDYSEALEFALRLVEIDRAHEGGTQLIMRAFAATGRRGAALEAYDALAAHLAYHLGMLPSPSTAALRERIVAGNLWPASSHARDPFKNESFALAKM